jgi:triosephosphate isomerase
LSPRTPLIAGNWKMNLSEPETRRWCGALREELGASPVSGGIELAVFPAFPSIAEARAGLEGLPVSLGGQNLHWEVDGAYTGEVSAHMLVDAGCRYVLCGHSERRQIFGESDQRVGRKAAAARAGGLLPVLCVGETERQRDEGATLTVVEDQLRHGLGAPGPDWTAAQLVLAYEPVWAIGTGRVATPEQVAEVHRSLREALAALVGQEEAGKTRILYGGSVKPSNAADLLGLEDVDGALIGGASLDATSFLGIARAA